MTDEMVRAAAALQPGQIRRQQYRKFLTAIQELYESDRGKIAGLKRNAGNTLSEARGISWIYRYLQQYCPPHKDRPGSERNENLCLLVASLMTFDREVMLKGIPEEDWGGFGKTLGTLRSPEERSKQKPGQTPLERRLSSLLDATFSPEGGGEMAYRLRQAVKFALQKKAPNQMRIDWPCLLYDLMAWNAADKRVQKQWARSFYSVIATPTGEEASA